MTIRPSYGILRDIPTPKLRPLVENPYFSRAHPSDATNPRTIPAMMNIRESAITTLAARGVLDAAQVAAVTHFRALWESMGGKGASAIDGGKARDPITERQVNADKELARCRALLGARMYGLVSAVCGEGFALTEIFARKRERLTAADCLRMSLDDLAELWRMATRR
ncbi:hypothetical protein [Rhizobium leguminosarum]|uniref:Uncharacterized protein n=2 Tax=Rhizobium leguminosarum TaxID=384 RepID=A0A6P0BB43_RHILE|nr:hypothetical protein [Rhizobium leguminosarum]MBY5440696.1 hypothetical protein [Rhizobium leguminosarum]NEI36366.1 hypothetical protein [Rhizobium leguminosarum]NEI42633.1 hypothetical protein [Rhizobium leguminosarum]